ncbi:GIY-YIG nuclease family protein [Candidatus Peregrinibacteria bacterium]|nr:GIY-YIG nuclease family protein [Candidatus Peregrinibacteria bacterium]
MKGYFYIYVLECDDGNWYTGYTKDLNNRIKEHKQGLVKSTKNRLPVSLLYFEGCKNQQDATHREKYLKSTYGKRFIRNRNKNYFTG